jgi:hypothetical protein
MDSIGDAIMFYVGGCALIEALGVAFTLFIFKAISRNAPQEPYD